MLILGFLLSASKVLSQGDVPSFSVSKKETKHEDDDDPEETKPQVTEGNLVEENEFLMPYEFVRTRGTVLITLRNVPPYTLW